LAARLEERRFRAEEFIEGRLGAVEVVAAVITLALSLCFKIKGKVVDDGVIVRGNRDKSLAE
jgi:hypothetical protein